MPPSKQQLRSTIAAKRSALDAQWLHDNSARVVERLHAHEAFSAAKTVALYMAIDGEVQLNGLFPSCRETGKQTCIPLFNPELKRYEMAQINADTRFRTGNYGIPEPISPVLISLDSIDLMIVPGVAFDAAGNRLGRGGGYYDRLLAGFSGFSAAVAFDFQIVSEVPCAAHDRPVDCVITPTKILKV